MILAVIDHATHVLHVLKADEDVIAKRFNGEEEDFIKSSLPSLTDYSWDYIVREERHDAAPSDDRIEAVRKEALVFITDVMARCADEDGFLEMTDIDECESPIVHTDPEGEDAGIYTLDRIVLRDDELIFEAGSSRFIIDRTANDTGVEALCEVARHLKDNKDTVAALAIGRLLEKAEGAGDQKSRAALHSEMLSLLQWPVLTEGDPIFEDVRSKREEYSQENYETLVAFFKGVKAEL